MTESSLEPRKTPLCEAHKRLGAKMIDFGGWLMPVQYPTGILEEHRATRQAVGLFDASHMGEVHFRGHNAVAAVQKLVTNDVGKLADGHAMYAVACHPNGGIVDDLIIYKVRPTHIMIVVNASNHDKDVAWFREHTRDCEILDASADTALIAFQGPLAEQALQPLAKTQLHSLKSFDFVPEVDVAGIPTWIARTGYTAEDGFELFCRWTEAEELWNAVVAAAAQVGGKPAGLGARDTLRLEGRLSLYGNDLNDETTPLEAGLGWVVKLDGGFDFIGKEALLRQRAAGLTRKLAGFVMTGRGIARHGYPIHEVGPGGAAGTRIGAVTSGAPGPTVGKNVGMGYVPAAVAEPGHKLMIDCRGKMVEAEIVSGPFYKRAKRG